MTSASENQPGTQPPTTAVDATWSMQTLMVITVIAIIVALAIVRLARMRLLPPDAKKMKPTSGRRSSAWAEAGRRLKPEPKSEGEDSGGDPGQEPHG